MRKNWKSLNDFQPPPPANFLDMGRRGRGFVKVSRGDDGTQIQKVVKICKGNTHVTLLNVNLQVPVIKQVKEGVVYYHTMSMPR